LALTGKFIKNEKSKWSGNEYIFNFFEHLRRISNHKQKNSKTGRKKKDDEKKDPRQNKRDVITSRTFKAVSSMS
jgi:hypothetical protein